MNEIKLNMTNADVRFYPNFFTQEESQTFFNLLMQETDWQQYYISMYGKQVPRPRLEAWYGDKGKAYSYSGIKLNPLPWTQPLLSIKKRVEQQTQHQFNSVLLNQYRTGKDSVSWHSDAEPELGQNPVIASVSFGATRAFRFMKKDDKTQKEKIMLTNGSLLLMAGTTQHHWKHEITKTKKQVTPRVNLTFRTIY